VIKQIKDHLGESVEILALGTNAIATAQMLKARANRGASGENAIVHTVTRVDLIVGPIGIALANAMMGEVSPAIAAAVASAAAPKLLIPLTQENVVVVGAAPLPLPRMIETMIRDHLVPWLAEVMTAP